MMTISVKPTRHQGTQCGVQGTPGGAPAIPLLLACCVGVISLGTGS